MAITFCSLDSNKQVNSVNENSSGVKESTKLERANLEEKPDVAEFSKKEDKKEKTSLWQGFKNGYTSFKKFLITSAEYTKGTLKGLVYGGVTALTVVGADALRSVAKKSEKTLSTKGKVFAGVAGVAVFALSMFKANLNANSKKADVDHRWQTGHNRV